MINQPTPTDSHENIHNPTPAHSEVVESTRRNCMCYQGKSDELMAMYISSEMLPPAVDSQSTSHQSLTEDSTAARDERFSRCSRSTRVAIGRSHANNRGFMTSARYRAPFSSNLPSSPRQFPRGGWSFPPPDIRAVFPGASGMPRRKTPNYASRSDSAKKSREWIILLRYVGLTRSRCIELYLPVRTAEWNAVRFVEYLYSTVNIIHSWK